MDTKVYKGVKFDKESILDVQKNYKPTETFQNTNFYPCHPPGVETEASSKGKRSGF